MKDDRRKNLKLTVKLRLHDHENEMLPGSVAYVYDTAGRFLASATAAAEPESTLNLNLPIGFRGRSVRVLLGPPVAFSPAPGSKLPEWMEASLREVDQFPEHPTRDQLKRLGAIEQTVRLADLTNLIEWPVYPGDWGGWLTCHCTVRGRLVKQVPLPDGTVQDWGVCHACVLIYDVDAFPRIIARLPDHDVYRIRDELLREIRRIPEDLPEPPEPPVELPPPPPPPPMRMKARSRSESAERLRAVREVAAEVRSFSGLEEITMAASASQLRQVLIEQGTSLIRYLCGWPWFMQWYQKDLLTCAMTDDQGYFETTLTYPCFGDHPDLYFRALQWTGGSLHVLYDPGMRCHTHWNYPCGSEVLLVTDDPAARVCEPPPDVDLPPGVGTYVLINRIGGLLIDSIDEDGLVGYDFVDGSGHTIATGAPFGGTLGFRTSHSPDIPTAGLKYYRWLYHKDGEVDTSGEPIWHEFTTPPAVPVGRNFADYDLTQPLKPPTFPVYNLGPKSLAGLTLYEFRPQESELQATAPPNHLYQWPVEAVGNDIYSGKLDSRALPGGPGDAVGLYWFKLEVYNASGVQVMPGSGTFEFVVLTSSAGDSRLPLPGEVEDGGFVFGLVVDNRECEAVIDPPAVAGVGADPNCGFLKFGSGESVTLDFHALQPHTSHGDPPANRATFHYWIRRGASIIETASGETAALAAGNWTGDNAGNFHATFAPGVLLGACKQAAFAEVLRVYAKATNGWRRLHEYDDRTEWAFALTPQAPGTGTGTSV